MGNLIGRVTTINIQEAFIHFYTPFLTMLAHQWYTFHREFDVKILYNEQGPYWQRACT